MAMRMPSPLSNCVPGEISLDALAAGAEMLAHHFGVALKTAGGEDHGVGVERSGATISGSGRLMPLTAPSSAITSAFASHS